jgi:Flp pilus assembly protein TadD
MLTVILLLAATGLPQTPKTEPKPLDRVQILALLAGGVPSKRLAMLVNQRGIDFDPTPDYLKILEGTGAEEALLKALGSAKQRATPTLNSALAAKKTKIQEYLVRGVELFKQKRYAEAEQEYRAALQLDANNLWPHFFLAQVFDEQHNWDGAILEYRQAIRLSPDNADLPILLRALHVLLGAALADKGDHDGAIAEHREAIRLEPGYYDAHYNLGLSLLKRGNFDEAIAELREAIRLQPDDANAHDSLGVALYKRGEPDAAIAEYREAIRLQPDQALAHTNLGAALSKKGDFDGAIAEMGTAIRLRPDDADAHAKLAGVLKKRGDLGGAIAEYQEAVRLEPGYTAAHVVLGDALETKGDLDGAIAEYRAVVRLEPNRGDRHFLLGYALEKRGDIDGAIVEYREAIRLQPDEAVHHYALAVALRKKGDQPGALDEGRKAYLLNPKDPRIRENYERLLRNNGGEASRASPPIPEPVSSVTQAGGGNQPTEEVPPEEVSKLQLNCYIEDNGWLSCEVYNGSTWTILQIRLMVVVQNKHGKEILRREYKLPGTYPETYMPPLTSQKILAPVGFTLGWHQRWSFVVTGAKGKPR